MSIDKFKNRMKSVGVLYIDMYPYRVNTDGKVEFLVLKRNTGVELAESWQTISGKIKENETIKQAFWRQATDKIGATPNRIFKIDYVSTFYDDYYDTVMMVPVAACEVPFDLDVQLSDLHVEYKWLSIENALEFLIWPNQKTSMELIVKMLRTDISKFHELSKPE